MRVIGLTGGIACGKSAFSAIACEFDSLVIIDCDLIAKQVCAKGKSCVIKLVKAFGNQILVDPSVEQGSQFELNRKALGEIVFKDEVKLKVLIGITGPAIFNEIAKQLLYNFAIGTPIVILDAPTLYESKKLLQICAAVVVVAADEDAQLRRIMERDGLSEELALDRIRSQLPLSEKVHRANYVIWNNGSTEEFEKKVRSTVGVIKQKYAGSLSKLLSIPGVVILCLVGMSLSKYWKPR